MSARLSAAEALLGDIGGTNTRLALGAGGRCFEVAHFANTGAAGPDELIERYLRERGLAAAGLELWLAVAAPVRGATVELTNLAWRISAPELEARFGFRRVRLINDFAAVALALGALDAADCLPLGGGPGAADAPRLVLGPGTGLGAALWIPAAGRDCVLATEAGHATLAAGDEREAAVIAAARRRHGHVSAERLLSGPGLGELYRALAEVEGQGGEPPPPAAVAARALAGSDPLAVAVLELFFSLLGGFAGNLALSTGARGGVFLAGGILPRLREPLAASAFRARFVAKGRFAGYLEEIPLALILHPDPGLLGLASAARPDPARGGA
ncbi:MAG: glucokinase [Pseudomonadota bacterium]